MLAEGAVGHNAGDRWQAARPRRGQELGQRLHVAALPVVEGGEVGQGVLDVGLARVLRPGGVDHLVIVAVRLGVVRDVVAPTDPVLVQHGPVFGPAARRAAGSRLVGGDGRVGDVEPVITGADATRLRDAPGERDVPLGCRPGVGGSRRNP
jgi:hypothetical protein